MISIHNSLRIICLTILITFDDVWGFNIDSRILQPFMNRDNGVQKKIVSRPIQNNIFQEPSSRRDILVFGGGVVAAIGLNPLPAFCIDVSSLRVEGSPKPDGDTIELGGISYTKAAMILQMAEQTASMEGMMRASAQDMQKGKTTLERFVTGSKGEGPGVIGRNDLTQSIGVMVKNSKIDSIVPAAAITLNKIPRLVNTNGSGDIKMEEYIEIADTYEAARETLRVAFAMLPAEEQQQGRKVMQALRAKDTERMQRYIVEGTP